MLPPFSDSLSAIKRVIRYVRLSLYLHMNINLSGVFGLCVGEHGFACLKFIINIFTLAHYPVISHRCATYNY